VEAFPSVRTAILTREFPPDVYGGAGVHVEFLARELAGLVDLDVEAFAGHPAWSALDGANPALRALSTDLSMTAACAGADVVHSHTWYANLAGHLASLLYDVPHVVTSHSLEPLRPWKAEQLGGGYAVSSWAERTALEAADAVIAVSDGMRADVLSAYPAVDPARVHVVHNGIDTDLFSPRPDPDLLRRLGVDPDAGPVAVFVGRITRQKGVPHLLRAMRQVRPDVQLLLAAGSPDTPEIAAEVDREVAALAASGRRVVHVRDILPRPDLVAVLSTADVFVCPSVYEPLGIVNLEAMACRTAVVASAVGGIPEVVVDGETGRLVPYDADDPAGFEAGLAAAVDEVTADRDEAAAYGANGRDRAVASFGWPAIAQRTVDVYNEVITARSTGS
jgi:alpha-maltose-1-phosphate synthase